MLRILPILLILLFPAAASAAPSDFDAGFGSNGRAIVDFGGSDEAYATAVQPDGKILVAGYTSLKSDAAVARLNPDGSSDRGFGENGVALIESDSSEWIYDIALQPDGKIVVAGFTYSNDNGFARRLNADGSPDKGFGTDGLALVDSGGNETIYGVAVQPDGAIVLAGTTSVDQNIAVYRLTPGGKPDNSFDNDGARGIDVLGIDASYDVALQADGKIVVFGGSRKSLADTPYPTIARFTTKGEPDTTFGPEGYRTAKQAGMFYAGDVQPDGRIVATGEDFGNDATIHRFTTAGEPDESFSQDGWVGLDLGSEEAAYALRLQNDGKIVVAGATEAGYDATVWRVNGDGTPDRGFGENGGLALPATGIQEAADLALQPDGKIVVVGTKNGTYADVLVLRLLGDYQPPPPAQPQPGAQQPPTKVVRCGGLKATIVGTAKRDVIRGTRRRDVIAALGGNDVVRGLGGNDVICGGKGKDRLIGGAGKDRLIGGAGRDQTRQ
jgi:uncharacterized delta-60 repeat protein